MEFYTFSALLLCFMLAASVKAGVTKEEMEETFKLLSAKCKESTGASDADIEAIMNHQLVSTPEGKCLKSCLMTKFELLDSNNKLIMDKMMKMADFILKGDAEKLKVAQEILEECKDVTDGNQCEAAFNIMSCIKEGCDKRGVKAEW